jgi:hypothetical protein
LLVSLESTLDVPPSLALIDTRKGVGGAPVQTLFHLSPYFINSGDVSLILERGMHRPSPAESLAPFWQDPAQRIAVLDSLSSPHYLAFRIGALLEFLGSREGTEIRWDEWKGHVVIPFIDGAEKDAMNVWVSGSRLFVICLWHCDPTNPYMEVYDLSIRGRKKWLTGQVYEEFGGVRYLLPIRGAVAQLPWDWVNSAQSGHDSVVFAHVSVLAPCFLSK